VNIGAIQTFAPSDVATEFPLLHSLLTWRLRHTDEEEALAVEVFQPDWPSRFGVNAPMLVLALPERCSGNLDELARSPVTVFNHVSDDLLSSRTMLALETGAFCIEVDVRNLRSFPVDSPAQNFFVCLATQSRALMVEHYGDDEQWESLILGLQAACIGSGPNYNPYRIWSPQQLANAGTIEEEVAGGPLWLDCRVLNVERSAL
jgi:hypothetical protein